MSRYDDYITRLCRTGNYTIEQAKKLALSKEIEKYYQSEDGTIEEKVNLYADWKMQMRWLNANKMPHLPMHDMHGSMLRP